MALCPGAGSCAVAPAGTNSNARSSSSSTLRSLKTATGAPRLFTPHDCRAALMPTPGAYSRSDRLLQPRRAAWTSGEPQARFRASGNGFECLTPLERCDPGTQAVPPDGQPLAGEVDDEGGRLRPRRQRGVVVGDRQAARRMPGALGGDHDQGAVILLVRPLHEQVALDRPGAAVREIDHVIGRPAGAVVEAGVADIDARAPALHIMAAGAALEANAADDHAAVVADVDAVRAIVAAKAEAREGRMLDANRSRRIVVREDAALAVAKRSLADHEIPPLEPDSRAVSVSHGEMLEGKAFDQRAAPAQHQRRLSLAGHSVEHRGSRLDGDIAYAASFLHRALAVAAGGDQDRARSAADRVDGILQGAKAPPALLDHERRLASLGPGSGGRPCGEQHCEQHFHVAPTSPDGLKSVPLAEA